MPVMGAGECVTATALPSGERRRFEAGGLSSPRSMRNDAKPLVVLVGILEALDGAAEAMGEASGLHAPLGGCGGGPPCVSRFSIAHDARTRGTRESGR